MSSKKRREARSRAGQCLSCGAPAEIKNGQTLKTCSKCRQLMAEAHQRWASRQREASGVVREGVSQRVVIPPPARPKVLRHGLVVTVPAESVMLVRNWVNLRAQLITMLTGSRRLLARTMLALMATVERDVTAR